MSADVLVVDDEADIRDLVAGILEDEGYAVRTAADSDQALAAIRARKPALLVLDIWMQGGGMDGLELLDMVKALDADLPVIMISGHGNIETAVSAIKRGAYEFLEKPFKSDRLLLVVERALEAAGPLGQLTPYVPVGYGFAAIIVAFVGRLHPVGIVFSALVMSLFYIGGELAQSRMGLPKSITGVFQGLLLFALLACDTLIHYRVRWLPPKPAASPAEVPKPAEQG